MKIALSLLVLLIAVPAYAAVLKAKQASYAVEVEAAKIIKAKCKTCKDDKIRASILKQETKGPYSKADELARDALKAAH